VLDARPGATTVRSLVILSQDIHAVFGGVVPELASRAHVEAIGPVVKRALAQAHTTLDDVDGIAVTAGPGLVGALLVGLMYGKTLAWSRGIPLIGDISSRRPWRIRDSNRPLSRCWSVVATPCCST
jgi:N6-L-threonylcarbamoyladenine synthase